MVSAVSCRSQVQGLGAVVRFWSKPFRAMRRCFVWIELTIGA